MKKNNISIDFIVFGDLDPENTKKLETFNENIKGGDGSHIAIIPPGPSLLSDHIASSPILASDGVAPRGEPGMDGGTGGGDFEFGVDPSTDPELALALRMSMEEEKARQEKEGKAQGEGAEPTLEGIPEEQPLLNEAGEASAEASGGANAENPAASSAGGSGEASAGAKKDKDDEDKMDTA